MKITNSTLEITKKRNGEFYSNILGKYENISFINKSLERYLEDIVCFNNKKNWKTEFKNYMIYSVLYAITHSSKPEVFKHSTNFKLKEYIEFFENNYDKCNK